MQAWISPRIKNYIALPYRKLSKSHICIVNISKSSSKYLMIIIFITQQFERVHFFTLFSHAEKKTKNAYNKSPFLFIRSYCMDKDKWHGQIKIMELKNKSINPYYTRTHKA